MIVLPYDEKSSPLSAEEKARLAELKMTLDACGAAYQILVHESNLASAEDGASSGLGLLEEMAPTFILRSKIGYFAAVVRGDTRLSYKKIKHEFGLKDISLTSPAEVEQFTGARVGYVSMVNPGIKTLVDGLLLEKNIIYGGTGVANHTLAIDPRALVDCTRAQVFDFSEPKQPSLRDLA
jgi:prolyl-tRNA editing enzyme YbaK/EbsC (Cys-tRNA(Pro) deacylase)